MKKKIIISAVSVGLALAVIGASVGTYMSYIKKYVPIAPPSALAYTKSNSQKVLIKNADFYVSVNGDDNGDGTLEKPFQTIKRAQQAVREAIANSDENKISITVAIMEGTYYETGIAFDEKDSSKSTSVTYTSYGDGEVILCGGKILTFEDFSSVDSETAKRLNSQAANKVKMIDLKKHGLTKSDYGKIKATGGFNTEEYYDDAATENPCELFFNDKRMTIARYPNDSYITVGKVSDIGDCYEPNAPSPTDESWLERRNQRGGRFALDKDTYSRVKSWQNTDDLWAFGYFYWDWADMSTPIKSINDDKTITTEYCSKYGFKEGGYYYFFNVLEELDIPGEYYIDRDNGILYFYPPDENENSKIMLSTSNENIISITEKASNITVDGLTLQGTRTDALNVAGENCKIVNCTVKNAAECGINVSGRNNLVENCEVAFIGKDAVVLSGGSAEGFVYGNNTVTNNSLHDYGEIQKTYIAGVNLSGIGNTVSHNEIYNAPHMGVYYTGNENVMEYNYIHDVVLQSSDAGAIYTGYSYSTYGNVVRYNCISNIGSGTFTPSGIYFDDNSSGQTAYGNVLINIPGYAFLVGGGRDNMIENNLVINAGKQILYDDRAYDGYHNDGWYAKNCKTPDSRLWQLMKEAKEFNASIGNKYDGIERMHQDYEREEDEGFAVNPSGSSVQNNIIISKQNKVGEIAKSVKKYSVVKNNQTFTLNGAKSSFEDYENGDYRIKADSKISKKCPDFKEIPFNEIGGKTPMEIYEHKGYAAFELMEKLGIEYFCFHDRDIAPEGATLKETNDNLDKIVPIIKSEIERTGIKLLWGTANCFNNPRYMCGAGTSPNAEVFAYVAAQIKKALEITVELGGQGYVFWGGREGYDTLLNTDMAKEQDNMAYLMKMAVDYGRSIGFTGDFYIEPKPKEPTKHQYDFDVSTVLAFLRKYGLDKDFKMNIEANHATLAGHTFQHELRVARDNGVFGSIDANQGDMLLGWDTDQFPTDLYSTTMCMYEVLKNGGFTNGGLNFDAKARRASNTYEDIFQSYIAGMDAFAYGLIVADKIISDGVMDNFVQNRYSSYTEGIGKRITDRQTSLAELEQYTLINGEPTAESGKQEYLETLVNQYIVSAGKEL